VRKERCGPLAAVGGRRMDRWDGIGTRTGLCGKGSGEKETGEGGAGGEGRGNGGARRQK